jgi:hypothetical protein
MKDKTIHTEGDVKFFLQAPTLALIPISHVHLNGKRSLWSRLRRKPSRPRIGAEA